MIRIERKSHNRLDIEFQGGIDEAGMRAAINELQTKSQGIEAGTMLYSIGDFDLPSFGAIAVEISRIPEMLRIMRRFRKVALLADSGWVRAVSSIEGALFPGMELKTFEQAERNAAEAWLAAE